jgi:hypothetical protein
MNRREITSGFWVIGPQRRPLLIVLRQINSVGKAGVNRHVLWTSINPEPVIFWAPEETSINRHVLWTSRNPEPMIFWAPEETAINRHVLWTSRNPEPVICLGSGEDSIAN